MTHSLLSIACHAYGLAALVYLALLVRPVEALAWAGRLMVGGGLLLHGVALAFLWTDQGSLPVGMAQGFSTVAFLSLAIFLALDVAYRRPVLGAFVTPLAVAVLVPGVLLRGGSSPLDVDGRQPLLPVHVSVALLGLAAFAVAAMVAAMYLLMERQVKGKKFGLLFARLPSLQFLDELHRKLVLWGFLALSLTLVSGAFFASRSPGGLWQWEWKTVATLVAWVVFGTTLQARMFGGWRGRRVALLTMAGFGILLLSFLSSYAPLGGGAFR
ncbi:MAG: cytochrome c biogenesis protein CcsA [Myxococcaceae bacterium]|nr:cytochrome c biogenesis protein CcsA [Myxococcaceae bacterium]MCI0672526.1 cytochrome c biogenesis protein CcsA [Myxococcaceae bacterium]